MNFPISVVLSNFTRKISEKRENFKCFSFVKKIVNIEEKLVTWIRFNFLGIQDLDPDPHLNEMNYKKTCNATF